MFKRINREDVRPVQSKEDIADKRPIKGADLFPEIYANIFMCARKKSGKTQCINHTIRACATSETRVIAFVSTLNRDATWKTIQETCERMKVKFDGFTSIVDPNSGEDILDGIVKRLEGEVPADKEAALIPRTGAGLIDGMIEPDENGKVKKSQRPKEKAPKVIFIFDDLSQEISRPSVTALMKKNRQFKSKMIIASQYWNDLALQARKQIDYVLLWPGLAQSTAKLEEIYKNCDLALPFELFLSLYRFCTSQKYNFMWIDVTNSEFRRNFTHKFEGLPTGEEPAPEDELPEREA